MALSQFGDHSAYLLDLGPHKDFSGPDVPKLQQENPLGRALQEKLSALPGIDYITTYDQACVQIPEIWEGEPFHVTGFNEEQMTALFTEDMILDGFVDHRRLLHENGILVSPGGSTLKTVYHTEYQPGDTVTLESYSGQTKTYTVQGIVKHPQIGPSCFFILPTEELAVLYPEIDDFTTALNLHTKKDSEQLRQAVFDTVTSDNITISVLGDRTAEIKVSLQDEMRKYYGILIFVFLFSLINLANTLITNLLARQHKALRQAGLALGRPQSLFSSLPVTPSPSPVNCPHCGQKWSAGRRKTPRFYPAPYRPSVHWRSAGAQLATWLGWVWCCLNGVRGDRKSVV